MRKFLLFFIIGSLVISGLGASGTNIDNENIVHSDADFIVDDNGRDYTHTVFVEWGTAQFCGPCSSWTSYIWNEYNNGNRDFEYATMIVYGYNGWSDILNVKASQWKSLYGITGYPTSILDGDYQRVYGNVPSEFPGKLDACGNRAVDDIEATLTVNWEGDAKLKIDIEIINNEASTYSGYIRVPITEIISRYTNSIHNNYNFGFLDYPFPMNQAISIPAGDTYTDSIVWDGSEHKDNHGDYFDDIDPDNIKVFLGVFDNDDDFVDECVASTVIQNQKPDKPIIAGPDDGEPGIEYEYNIEITDPEEDDMYVWIDWGDETQGWLGPYESGTILDISHSWDDPGIYEVRAKSRDVNYQESEWSDIITVSIGNLGPNKPEINGPPSGLIDSDIEFGFVATDPNNDQLLYFIDWGDGNTEEWIGPYDSGEEVFLTHSWNEEKRFSVKAKVKDPDGIETGWTYHNINIPRTRFNHNFHLANLFERFSVLFQILNHILG